MAYQCSVDVRNAGLDARFDAVGPNPILKIRTGAQPVNVAAADTGTVLAAMELPNPYMDPAAGGTKSKAGTWQDLSADASGTAAHWRLYENDGVTCHMQGDVTPTGGGGNLQLDNVSIVAGQRVTVTAWVVTGGNA